MATTPTMGRPTIGRPADTPNDTAKTRLYWGIALAVIVLVAIGLAMRNRNRISSVIDRGSPETTISTPASDTTTNMQRGMGPITAPPMLAPNGGAPLPPPAEGAGPRTAPPPNQ